MTSEAALDISYDPYAPQMQSDPWDTFRLLRDHAPVFHNEELDIWVLSRYEDVKEAAKHSDRFSSAKGVTILLDPVTKKISPTPVGPGDFLEMDPPEHGPLRAVVRGRFTPPAIAALEPVVRKLAHDLIDDFIEEGEADLAQQYGRLLPSLVITHMLGLPREDAPTLSKWFSQATDLPLPGQDAEEWSQQMMQGAGNMWVRLAEVAEQRKAEPRDDILTDVVQATIDGESLGDRAVGMCFLLYAAGEDTTTALITNSIRILDASREHRQWLLDHPDRYASAIDELLRYDGPFLSLARVTKQPVTLHGVTIPANARVVLAWASANRDERQFESPEILDFERPKIAHLGFGHGLHHCLGHVLAKLEGRIALETLLERIPDYEVTGVPLLSRKPFIRGFHTIPAKFTPGARRS